MADTVTTPDCRLYVSYYGENDEISHVFGKTNALSSTESSQLKLKIPNYAHPIFEVGIELLSEGTVFLDCLKWSGVPNLKLGRPKGKGTMWRRAWVNAVVLLVLGQSPTGWYKIKDPVLLFRVVEIG